MCFYKNKSPAIHAIIEKWFDEFKIDDNHALLPIDKRQKLVDELKDTYERLSYNDRTDSLIPRSAEFLKEVCIMKKDDIDYGNAYCFLYDWPNNDKMYPILISKNTFVDRIGGEHGTYVCRLDNQVPFTIEQRSLPYYFSKDELIDITKCPSYHRYKFCKFSMDARMSKTKPAFNQKGGSTEIVFSDDIYTLINNGSMKEIIYAKR